MNAAWRSGVLEDASVLDCCLSTTGSALASPSVRPARIELSGPRCHSRTACCNSSKAFNSSKRPVRALPASVFKSASAIGGIPSRPSKLVPKAAKGGVAVDCDVDTGGSDSPGAEMGAGAWLSMRSTGLSARVATALLTFSC